MFNINISKAKTALQVDWDNMPQNAKDYIIQYGLKQKLNDCYATVVIGADNPADVALSAASEMLANLMAGNITIRAAASVQSLEDKVRTRIIRANFKKYVGEKISTLAKQDNESLIAAIAIKTGKPVDFITTKLEERVAVEVELEKNKPVLPEIQF